MGSRGKRGTGYVRVCGGLYGAEAVADDEDEDAEAGGGVGDCSGDAKEGAEAIEKESRDEGRAVAIVAEDPGCMAEGGHGVGSVGGFGILVSPGFF